MTREEERYYEIGKASYEWVGERGDTEFRLGAKWADKHPDKVLIKMIISLYKEAIKSFDNVKLIENYILEKISKIE